MNKTAIEARLTGPDIVRVVAAFFMVAVHFFMECGYYATLMNTPVMFILTVERWLFMCCVPLYMMLTGFFKCNKEPDKAHYASLVPVFISYLFFSVLRLLVNNYYYGEPGTVKDGLKMLGDYSLAWYVGFYISLMAIAPFLNRLWHALKSKKEQHILLISLAAISMVYPLVLLPVSSETNPVTIIGSILELAVPNYWQMLYPLVYYFLGCYIRENRPRLNKVFLFFVVLAMVFVNATISFVYADGDNFDWFTLGRVDSGYNCLTLAICATALFLLLYDIEVKNMAVRYVLAKISSVSLEIYLASAVMETIIFDRVNRMFFTIDDYAWLIFLLVPLNFICSLLISLIYKKLYDSIRSVVSRARK